MDKYKAVKSSFNDGGANGLKSNKINSDKHAALNNGANDVEAGVEKTQDQINSENNANNIKNLADVAIATKNPYAVAAGLAVKGLDKITGGKTTQALGSAVNRATKFTPGGKQLQALSNQASESGVSDMVGKAANIKNASAGGAGGAAGTTGATTNASGATNNASTAKSSSPLSSLSNITGKSSFKGKLFGNNSSGKSSGFLSFLPKPLRIKLYISLGCSCFLLLCLMTVFVDTDELNIDSSSSYQASATGTTNSEGSNSSTPTGQYMDNFTFFYQGDYDDINEFNFGGNTIANVGCAPTAMAMVLTNILGREVTPIEMAQYTLDNDHVSYTTQGNEEKIATGSGTSLFQPAATDYKVNYERLDLNEDNMKNSLSQGKLIILLVGSGGSFSTTSNHFIILRGISDDKSQIYLADPANKSNNFNSDGTPKGWTYDQLAGEAKNAVGGGNYLFVFSKIPNS